MPADRDVGRRMGRLFLLLVIVLGLAPGTWVRDPPKVQSLQADLTVRSIPVPAGTAALVEIAGAWQLTSHSEHFGGYSGLLSLPDGTLFAATDGGRMVRFAPPGRPFRPIRMGYFEALHRPNSSASDIEGLTRDPVSGKSWATFERANIVIRHDAGLHPEAWAHPPAMRDWPRNAGAESIVRLADGRFVILSEGSPRWFDDRYPALLFPSDPVAGAVPVEFAIRPPDGFRAVDAAQLPDGRVLVLLRKVLWSLPPGFASKLMVADPGDIRAGEVWPATTVLDIDQPGLRENYEGMAIEPGPDGSAVVWLISDNNRTALQRTLLLKLLWPANEKARGTSRAPS